MGIFFNRLYKVWDDFTPLFYKPYTGYFKIIYKVEKGAVYITDFFDSRQDPEKMKG